MTGSRIALVEDDARMRATIIRGLTGEGMTVPVSAGTGAAFLAGLDDHEVDVAVLDVGLPDCDGRDLCLAMRARGIDVPVLFLTARDAVNDRVLGFQAGADDYLVKPFAFAELVARLSALARRHVRATADRAATDLAGGAVTLDPAAHALVVTGGPVASGGAGSVRRTRLTPTEFRLLSTLLGRRGEVVRRRTLVAAGWSDGSFVQDNTLDAYLVRLRRKVRDAGADLTITTVHGVGYQVDHKVDP